MAGLGTRRSAGFANVWVFFAIGIVVVLLLGVYAVIVDSTSKEAEQVFLQPATGEAEIRKHLLGLSPYGQAVNPNFPEGLGTKHRKPSLWSEYRDFVLFGALCGLLWFLTRTTLARQRHEAEARALAGQYLADGPEMAGVEIPELFARPTQCLRDLTNPTGASTETLRMVMANFFSTAPEHLAELRNVMYELQHAPDDARRRPLSLAKMHGLISALKGKSDNWDLRPAWQMASALELLLKYLADKPQDATPSTLRTVASAVEILSTLCRPGVRPDLLNDPPIAVLAADDDEFCRRAVTFALRKASIAPDLAEDGETAVGLAAKKHYDVIFMDIQMPGIDGFMACDEIHKTQKNHTTPVVFVTVQSDFHTRAQSALKGGGTELMAKPFLMFEITVKALTLAVCKRLNLPVPSDREVAAPPGQRDGAHATQSAEAVALAETE